MPIDIVVMNECADFYGVFKVPSFSGSDTTYIVTWHGAEGPVFCTCPAFEHNREDPKICKHISHVWEHGCFWHPQWHDGNDRTIKPVEYTTTTFDHEGCQACGGPVVPVRMAV